MHHDNACGCGHHSRQEHGGVAHHHGGGGCCCTGGFQSRRFYTKEEMLSHLENYLEQLQADDRVKEMVQARAAELLGGAIRIQFRLSNPTEEGGSPSDANDADSLPDKHQLLEAPAAATNPDALVEGLLGGQMIEEIVDED